MNLHLQPVAKKVLYPIMAVALLAGADIGVRAFRAYQINKELDSDRKYFEYSENIDKEFNEVVLKADTIEMEEALKAYNLITVDDDKKAELKKIADGENLYRDLDNAYYTNRFQCKIADDVKATPFNIHSQPWPYLAFQYSFIGVHRDLDYMEQRIEQVKAANNEN